MAGDWIKMRTDLFTHPKIVRMSSALKADGRPALKADRLRTVGGLLSVWCLFNAHSADGTLAGYSFEAVDEHVGIAGFAQAMADVEWLSGDAAGLVLPDFDKHNGQSAKRRAQDADRKREVRKESANEADGKRTREEKRREEKDKSAPTASAPAHAPENASSEKPSPQRRGTRLPADWQPTADDVQWAKAEHPGVDLRSEIPKFRDFWHAKAGADAAKLDWSATLRNWVRRAGEQRASGGQGGYRSDEPARRRQPLTREMAR